MKKRPAVSPLTTDHSPLTRPVVGWREWVALPELGIAATKAKIDTGARSSALHAFDVTLFQRRGRTLVRFSVHPIQRRAEPSVTAEAEVLEFRRVKSSGGHVTLRPVIVTEVELLGRRWPIELTLANRDSMGFRMLLGREAVRRRFLIDPGRSYLGGDRGRRRRQKRPSGDGREDSD
ncbi:MAG TPA: RimK/LysX family protein, partial [Planctomycetaceae bacterium]|nr:RimK/LysX family protein [Planctomycetaceae bacterium]